MQGSLKFNDYLGQWGLTPDGDPIVAHSSQLLPVRQGDTPVADLERKRLLQWILTWAGLSAAWWLKDGESPESDLIVAELAMVELAKN